jgi:hypothetical protein
MSLAINPETKVGALLEAYPELEQTLVECAPAFAKLRNPILRRTVARVATLEQAARIGGLSVRELVRRLREAAGLSVPELAGAEERAPDESAPAWLVMERIRARFDADAMLATGEHPIGRMRRAVNALAPGEIVELRSSFRPEPLIETFRRAGCLVHSEEPAPGRHATYITRRG